MYAFAEEFDLDVNEDVFIKAARGTHGYEKFKPSGDRSVSWLERVDSIGNGAPNANGWLQAVFEYESFIVIIMHKIFPTTFINN